MVARIMVAAMMIGIVVLPIRLRAYRALLTNADYPKYESVVASLRREDISMLIAPRGLDFFYSYRLRRDAFHFDPEPEWDHTRIWRVAARVTSEEFAYYSPSECRWGEMAKAIPGTGYLLVREDCWQQFRARVSREENPDLYIEVRENSENPSQQRPEFLRARHRR